ncbi:MAG: tripartite tricarboxylate transporter TctB family protein, partial [Chloroflexota bacterium]
AVVAASAGYVWLLPLLGHMVAGTVVALVMLQVMGLASWPAKIVTALVLGAGSYFLFAGILGVPLPAGTLFG